MIDEDKYCIDICNQLMAADSIIRKANNEILQSPYERLRQNMRWKRAGAMRKSMS
jgi:DNA-binding FrmR family transcriptional regulator